MDTSQIEGKANQNEAGTPMQSPSKKKRPLSGGPSPDKFKLAKQEADRIQKEKMEELQAKLALQKEAEAFLQKKEQAMAESREASIALKRA